ncbi:MAG: GDSL-type esterase/lipase family protein [Deltaproteobacteria bacterium]|nr:GDSL-type esterase/lipase family protein [Deltaproteobacteria bacterium]
MAATAPPRRGAGLVVLLVTLLAVCALDRVLLRVLGLPVWQYDPVLLYTHRPNMVAAWDSFPGAYPLHTNRWGQADDDFPRDKPAGEWRAVVIGDSVAMGFGLPHAEALPDQLERRLTAAASRPVQVINAAVSGYSTVQYPEALRRALAFQPDLALIGFCLNDVLATRKSNVWFAFKGVLPSADPLLAWVVAETGFGRLALRTRSWLASGTYFERAAQYRRLAVDVAEDSSDDAEREAQWARALHELDLAVAVGREAGIPVAVLVFPYVGQLEPGGHRRPQARLVEWAARQGVPLFDAAPPLDRRVAAGEAPQAFFLDELHFRLLGNALIADALAAWLLETGMGPPPAPASAG